MKSKNIDLHFVAGNHDYWIGDFIKNEIMDTTYLNDVEIKINNKRIFVTHGDGLLSWDHGYRLLKTIIRSNLFTKVFKWLHPTIAYKLARFVSRSGKHNTYTNDFNKDVRRELKNSAEKNFEKGFDFMITGHYHLGELFKLKKGKLAILGDWFLDRHTQYLMEKDLQLKDWESIE